MKLPFGYLDIVIGLYESNPNIDKIHSEIIKIPGITADIINDIRIEAQAYGSPDSIKVYNDNIRRAVWFDGFELFDVRIHFSVSSYFNRAAYVKYNTGDIISQIKGQFPSVLVGPPYPLTEHNLFIVPNQILDKFEQTIANSEFLEFVSSVDCGVPNSKLVTTKSIYLECDGGS